jgi:hypothetical protein
VPLSGHFFDYLLAVNRPRLDGFQHWLLHPGMLFQARRQWWGQEKNRPHPHEGLDLCWFEDTVGRRQDLDHSTVIPAPFAGTVVKISPDFLGESIFLAHALDQATGRRLYIAFGHTAPRPGLAAGQSVVQADIIGSISAPANRRSSVPPHLHITLAWLPDPLDPEQLAWDTLGTDPTIRLVDPLAVFPTRWVQL